MQSITSSFLLMTLITSLFCMHYLNYICHIIYAHVRFYTPTGCVKILYVHKKRDRPQLKYYRNPVGVLHVWDISRAIICKIATQVTFLITLRGSVPRSQEIRVIGIDI